MAYIGAEPIVSATRTVTEVTATAGQTVFTANGGYTVGFLDVFINGSKLTSTDFTATNGTTVTLTEAAQVNDIVRLEALGTFNVALIDGSTITNGTITPAKLSTSTDFTFNGLTVGKGAGSVATNTAVGASALNANTSGSNNTAIGANSLDANTIGGYNVSFGGDSLGSNTSGNGNAAFGQAALGSNTTGTENTAIGSGYDTYAAMRDNTTGGKNVAVGSGALKSNTTASNNTAVGYQAGYTNTTNTAGAFFGYQAGYLATGDNNTFVGLQSGYRATGGNNAFIGAGSGGSVTSGAKNTIVGGYSGNQGGLNITTASNRIVLSDGDGNPRIYADNNGQFYSLITGVGLYADYGCRAWVNFNGTGTVAIRASGNISSITDNGTGDYTLNFSTAMPDTSYSTSWSSTFEAGSNNNWYSDRIFYNYGTSSVRMYGGNGASVNDGQIICAQIFR